VIQEIERKSIGLIANSVSIARLGLPTSVYIVAPYCNVFGSIVEYFSVTIESCQLMNDQSIYFHQMTKPAFSLSRLTQPSPKHFLDVTSPIPSVSGIDMSYCGGVRKQ